MSTSQLKKHPLQTCYLNIFRVLAIRIFRSFRVFVWRTSSDPYFFCWRKRENSNFSRFRLERKRKIRPTVLTFTGIRQDDGKGGLGFRGVAFMTVLAVLDCTLPSFCLSHKIQCQETTVTVLTVLAVSAVVAVSVVTATPLKLNPLSQRALRSKKFNPDRKFQSRLEIFNPDRNFQSRSKISIPEFQFAGPS